MKPAYNPKNAAGNSGKPSSITMAGDQEKTLKDTAIDQVTYPVTEASLVMKLMTIFPVKLPSNQPSNHNCCMQDIASDQVT